MEAKRNSYFEKQFLRITKSGGKFVVDLGPAVDAHIELRCRKNLFYERMSLQFERTDIAVSVAPEGWIEVEDSPELEARIIETLIRINKYIGQFLDQALTPHMVEEVLGITTRERSRWSKDGRLKRSGSAYFKRGNSVQIYMHPSKFVAILADDPSIIASWRAQDAESRGPQSQGQE